MAWATRRCLYHPPSEPFAVKFFPSSRPFGAVASRRFPFDRRNLAGNEGPAPLAVRSQPDLGGHAVLVITQDILQGDGGLGKPGRLLSSDRLRGFPRITRVVGEDADAMQLRAARRVGHAAH